jgi:spermidine synthase
VRPVICIMVFASGLAGLSWETLWQLQAALSLGVSARGAALTLVGTMGGMSLGAALAGRLLGRRSRFGHLRTYALLELVIGLAGLVLFPGFHQIEILSSAAWRYSPALASLLHLVGILVLLGPPAMAMGATIPVFGELARSRRMSLATLYGLNTAGATAGVLLISFLILPEMGVRLSARLVLCLNLAIAAGAWLLAAQMRDEDSPDVVRPPPSKDDLFSPRWSMLLAFTTGLVTFCLEVAWFRSLRATLQNSTDSFAIMLVSVLLPLSLGAALVPLLRRRGGPGLLRALLPAAGIAILSMTPLVERFDFLIPAQASSFLLTLATWLGLSLLVLGLPVLLLGTVLPWLLDGQAHAAAQGRLFAVNTAGAIVGSLGAAWLLLPTLGFARTAWLAGLVLLAVSLPLLSARRRAVAAAVGACALIIAIVGESGVGRRRVQSATVERDHRVLGSNEGPDSTVSVIEQSNHDRILVIDGFETTAETANAHYMAWMGRLPMLLHEQPRSALVICFGTGQTVNAVRQEGPESLDLVELNPAVLGFAPLFPTNQNVLADARVRTIVMDGRAWLRRTDRHYDVVTLEPMSPEFAGTNALYSVEFYRLVQERLNPGGIVAQWVPFHIVPPTAATSIGAAFYEVFPDAILWVDPRDNTGILVGRRAGAAQPLGTSWPGFSRQAIGRDLTPTEVLSAVRLGPAGVAQYSRLGVAVDDDNQLLAYGRLPLQRFRLGSRIRQMNADLVEKIRRAEPR